MYVNSTNLELDITQYLEQNGRIPRGAWHSIEVLPNSLAEVDFALSPFGFIQSRGSNTV